MAATTDPNPFPPLDRATEAALRASIGRFGVIVPVVEDTAGRLLDGHHRRRIARELGKEPPVVVVAVAGDDEAREVARTLNADRRHMTVEQRREVAVALRKEGHSLRAIGGALGVDQRTVGRDLNESGAASAAPHASVTGRDGKRYPVRWRPQRTKPAPAEPSLYVRFTVALDRIEDVLSDPAALAAAIPQAEHESWAGVLRQLAQLATTAADRVSPQGGR